MAGIGRWVRRRNRRCRRPLAVLVRAGGRLPACASVRRRHSVRWLFFGVKEIMALSQPELVKSLVDAGVHFGHRVSRWNPKMQPYIQAKRNMIHIIDVRETIKGLLRAKKLLNQTVASGKDVLFVGTKRQARNSVEEYAR